MSVPRQLRRTTAQVVAGLVALLAVLLLPVEAASARILREDGSGTSAGAVAVTPVSDPTTITPDGTPLWAQISAVLGAAILAFVLGWVVARHRAARPTAAVA